MSFNSVAALAVDPDFKARVAACYATEEDATSGITPNTWTDLYQWNIASAPGFGDAYAYAVANGNERPGYDEAVITDAMILSAVQALLTLLEPPPEVEPT